MRQLYQLVRVASITIQAFTRGWMARKRYKKVSKWLHPKNGGLSCNNSDNDNNNSNIIVTSIIIYVFVVVVVDGAVVIVINLLPPNPLRFE